MEQEMSLEEYKKAVEEEAKTEDWGSIDLTEIPNYVWQAYYEAKLNPAETLMAITMGL